MLPDVTTSLGPPSYDARYPGSGLSVQIPVPHLLETLQGPNSTVHYEPLPPNAHPSYGMHHHHPLLDMEAQPARAHLPALSPPSEFNFNIPQTRLSEPQLTVAHVLPPSTSSRIPNTMASATGDRKQQHINAPVKGTPSAPGSNAGSTRPPRREASTTVIACRQWCASFASLLSIIYTTKVSCGLFLNLLRPPIVALARFVATPQDHFAITVLGAITSASMTVLQSVGVPISVLALGNAHARSVLQSQKGQALLQRRDARQTATMMEI